MMSEQIEDLSTEVEDAPSMDDTIRQTLSEIEARGNEPEGVTEDLESEASRARDDKGRFAPKTAPEETPAPEGEPQPEPAPAEVETELAPVVVPPELQKLGLRKEEAEAFSKAAPEVQAAFIRRSEEMHRGIEQFRGKAQFGESVERSIAPYAQYIQQAGVTPDQAIAHLFQAEAMLRTGSPEQKQSYFAQLARDYGVDLGQTAEIAANQPQIAPEVVAMRQELQQMRSFVQQQNQAREWQERETLNSEISRFASDPAHTHFEEVREQMAGLLQAGLAPDLKSAYETAIYANPSIRTQVLAQQQAKADEARRAQAAQTARDAKTAAAVNVSRKGRLPAAKPVGTMDDTIREAAQRLGVI